MNRIFVLIAAAIAALLGVITMWAGVASAWYPVVSGQAACLTDGSWTVHWTVGNSETTAGWVMTFDSAKVNGGSISLSPSSVAPGESATGTSTHSAAASKATLVVNARWTYDNTIETATRQATVNRPDDCVAPTTTTTVAPTTTTTAPVVTTTVPAVTTTAPQVDDTTVTPAPAIPTVPANQTAGQVEAIQVSAGPNTLPVTGALSVPLLVGGTSMLLAGVGLVVAARCRGAAV